MVFPPCGSPSTPQRVDAPEDVHRPAGPRLLIPGAGSLRRDWKEHRGAEANGVAGGLSPMPGMGWGDVQGSLPSRVVE